MLSLKLTQRASVSQIKIRIMFRNLMLHHCEAVFLFLFFLCLLSKAAVLKTMSSGMRLDQNTADLRAVFFPFNFDEKRDHSQKQLI